MFHISSGGLSVSSPSGMLFERLALLQSLWCSVLSKAPLMAVHTKRGKPLSKSSARGFDPLLKIASTHLQPGVFARRFTRPASSGETPPCPHSSPTGLDRPFGSRASGRTLPLLPKLTLRTKFCATASHLKHCAGDNAGDYTWC